MHADRNNRGQHSFLATGGVQEQGNKALKTGLDAKKRFYLREAIKQYTEGLNLACPDAELNSVLYANRAHINLLLGNFRNALQDALAAAKANPTNLKVSVGQLGSETAPSSR